MSQESVLGRAVAQPIQRKKSSLRAEEAWLGWLLGVARAHRRLGHGRLSLHRGHSHQLYRPHDRAWPRPMGGA